MSAIDQRAEELGDKLGPALSEEIEIAEGVRIKAYFNAILMEVEPAGVYCLSEASVAPTFVPGPGHVGPAPPANDPWQYWDAATIATAANCPQSGVERSWPALHAELVWRDQASRNSQAASIATTAIETAHTFLPVREAFWLSEAWRAANLRYYEFYGRGLIQLTWRENYERLSPACGVDLVAEPDLALEPEHAAVIFAEYWASHDIQASADAEDWAACRRKVQGGSAGLDEFERIVGELL
jgi:hypothetical protein